MFAEVGKKLSSFGSSIYNGYKTFRSKKDKFLTHRYFVRDYDKVKEVYVDNGKRKVICIGKECCFPKKVSQNNQLETNSSGNLYLWDGKKRHPVVKLPRPYDQSCNGNTIYAIPSAQKDDFGFNKKDLENKTIVIEVDSSGKVVPVEAGKALYYSFSGGIKPTTFRVVDRKTKEIRWISSLIMLPFNLSGAACNFACRIAGGVLNKIGGLFLYTTERISKSLDNDIKQDKDKTLLSNQKLIKIRSIFTFVFESLASFFITTGVVVEGTGHTVDSLLRTPNLIFHHDDLDRKATWANIKSSFVNTFYDLSETGKGIANSLETCKARMSSDGKKLLDVKEGIDKNASDKTSKKNKEDNYLNNNSIKNVVKEVSKNLNGVSHSKTTVTIGTQKELNYQEKIAGGRAQTQSVRNC